MKCDEKCVDDINNIKYELCRAQSFEQMYYNLVECNEDLHAQIADLKSQNDKYAKIIEELSIKIQTLKDIIVEHEVYEHERIRNTKS